MRWIQVWPLIALVLSGSAAARAGQAGASADVVLSNNDTLTGWSPGASLATDRKEGSGALAWELPQGKVSSLSFALGAKRDAVARGRTLRFWYKVEGAAGVRTLIVKAVAYPLASGWQAIYHLTVPPAGEWRQARIALQEFEDQWGEAPDRSGGSLQFRVETAADAAAARLLVDDLRVTPLPPGAAVNTAEPKRPAPVTPLVTRDHARSLSAHPRLLVSAPELPSLKRRAEQTEWGRAFVADLKQRGGPWLSREIRLPDRGGQWFHWYACPKHGARLRTESPTRHACPVGGEVYTGYPYDDVVLSTEHDRHAGAVRDLGLLYRLTGERRYAAKAGEILLAYAARYLTYPLHDIHGKPNVGGGRVGPQTLDESTWLIPMAQGCDLIWDTLSPAEVETLRTKLFYPATEVIRRHRMGIHNIQCWKNSAVGLVGLLFGDFDLIAEAIDDPQRGMQAQILNGVTEDGPWYEGAWGYHFYTMSALQPLSEAAARAGIDVYAGPVGDRYRRFFLAPVEMAMPDGRLPAFNDSGKATARGNAAYEIAFARWKDPRLALPLQGSSRRTLPALVSGVESLPPPRGVPDASRNFPASGYAILRAGAGATATWLCLKYGPHGGGHGHPDKNHFVLYGGGRVLADDPGTANYGVPVQAGWYKTTLAHNTLVVDEENQKAATGRCLDFQTRPGWSGVLADAGPVYSGLTFRRAAFLLGTGLFVFLDLVRADDDKPRTLDLVYHPSGRWGAAAPSAAAAPPFSAPDRPGYAYLRDMKREERGRDGFVLALDAGGGAGSVVRFADAAPDLPDKKTTFLIGTGVGANTEDRVPVVIARRRAAGTTYAWSVSVTGMGGEATLVERRVTDAAGKPLGPGEAAAAHVSHAGKRYLVVANPSGRPVKVQGKTVTAKLAALPL